MKQLKIFLVALAVTAICVPAMAETTFTAKAQGRFGFQAVNIDKKDIRSRVVMAGLQNTDKDLVEGFLGLGDFVTDYTAAYGGMVGANAETNGYLFGSGVGASGAIGSVLLSAASGTPAAATAAGTAQAGTATGVASAASLLVYDSTLAGVWSGAPTSANALAITGATLQYGAGAITQTAWLTTLGTNNVTANAANAALIATSVTNNATNAGTAAGASAGLTHFLTYLGGANGLAGGKTSEADVTAFLSGKLMTAANSAGATGAAGTSAAMLANGVTYTNVTSATADYAANITALSANSATMTANLAEVVAKYPKAYKLYRELKAAGLTDKEMQDAMKKGSAGDAARKEIVKYLEKTRKIQASTKFMGVKNNESGQLFANFNEETQTGVFTAELAVNIDDSGVSSESAWLAYDLFKAVRLKYTAVGSDARWNDAPKYIGYSGIENAITIQGAMPMTGGYLTLMSAEGVSSPVKYSYMEKRVIPIMAFGYDDYVIPNMLKVVAGGVVDKPTKDGGDYMGYMGHLEVKYSMGTMGQAAGAMSFGLSGFYGANMSQFAGMSDTDLDKAFGDDVKKGKKDSTAYGVNFAPGVTVMPGMVIGGNFNWAQKKISGGDAWTGMKFEGMVRQYFAPQFYVGLGGGYESYSTAAGDKPDYANMQETGAKGWGYEAVVELGYNY